MTATKMKTLLSFGRGTVFPHRWSWMLELPGRDLIFSRRTLAQRLPLEPQHHVLEVGCGSGYYSPEVARRLGRGRLELFDLQPEMIEKARARIARLGLHNVGFSHGQAGGLPFADRSFDVIYMVTVFGEIDDKASFARELQRVLKRGGVLSISEHHPDPDLESPESVARQLESAGFVQLQQLGWRWAFTSNFRAP